MITVDLKSPVFKVLYDKSQIAVEKQTMKLSREGWYPVGEHTQKGNDWIQVMVKEGVVDGKVIVDREVLDDIRERRF